LNGATGGSSDANWYDPMPLLFKPVLSRCQVLNEKQQILGQCLLFF
jgi:hypothetical protein